MNDKMREFDTGATRNSADNKYDYEGFISPRCMEEFGKYMHSHRLQADGKLRDSDNWQKGIPQDVCFKSLLRHVLDLWKMHRGHKAMNPDTGDAFTIKELCCAIRFNADGYLLEEIKKEDK